MPKKGPRRPSEPRLLGRVSGLSEIEHPFSNGRRFFLLFAFYGRWVVPVLSSMTGTPQVSKAIKKHRKKLKIEAFRVGSGEKKEVLI